MSGRLFKEPHNPVISGVSCHLLSEMNKTHWRDVLVIFPYLSDPGALPAAEEIWGRNVRMLKPVGMCKAGSKAESACPLGEPKPFGFNQVTHNTQGLQTNQIIGLFSYSLKLKGFRFFCFQKCLEFSSVYIK